MHAGSHDGPIVFLTAAPGETAAVRTGLAPTPVPGPSRRGQPISIGAGRYVVESGIGKANAALAVSLMVAPLGPSAVINVGVAGALDAVASPIGSAVLASPSLFGDEGVQTPEGLIDAAALGFPIRGEGLDDRFDPNPDLAARLRPLVDAEAPVLTVSAGAGTDALRDARRAAGAAEAMEGAAAALACERLAIPFAEVRVISNTTGDRDGQTWKLDEALDRLTVVVRRLAGTSA